MPPTVSIDPPRIFIDTAGFIAIHVPTDAHHDEALSCRERTLRFARLFTSSAVIGETVAHIQRDNLLDQQSLHDLIEDFLAPGRWGAALLPIDDDVTTKSLRMVKDRQDRRFSFVDAANIVLMQKHQINTIFSFDGLYDGYPVQRGYTTHYIERIWE